MLSVASFYKGALDAFVRSWHCYILEKTQGNLPDRPQELTCVKALAARISQVVLDNRRREDMKGRGGSGRLKMCWRVQGPASA